MINPQTLASAIKSAAKLKGITIKKMLTECELGINTLSSMQSGGYFPRLEALVKIADYLDVSIDYLLGRGIPDASRLPHSGNNDIDNIVKDLLNKDITPDDIEVIKAVLNKYR